MFTTLSLNCRLLISSAIKRPTSSQHIQRLASSYAKTVASEHSMQTPTSSSTGYPLTHRAITWKNGR